MKLTMEEKVDDKLLTVNISDETTTPKLPPPPAPEHPPPQHSCNWPCIIGCCITAFAALGITTLILAFTVFKIKNPTLSLNNIYVTNLNLLFSTPNRPVSINATLIADISIKNPNAESFQFDRSTTKFYYMGETVGVGYAPWTHVAADRTVRMNVTVDVLADRVAVMANATGTVMAYGYVNLTSSTDVKGRVSVIGVFKGDIGVVMNCSLSLDWPLPSERVKYRVCEAYVE